MKPMKVGRHSDRKSLLRRKETKRETKREMKKEARRVMKKEARKRTTKKAAKIKRMGKMKTLCRLRRNQVQRKQDRSNKLSRRM